MLHGNIVFIAICSIFIYHTLLTFINEALEMYFIFTTQLSSFIFQLTLSVKDKGSIPHEVTRRMIVRLRDVNDNKPTFTNCQAVSYQSHIHTMIILCLTTTVADCWGQLPFGLHIWDYSRFKKNPLNHNSVSWPLTVACYFSVAVLKSDHWDHCYNEYCSVMILKVESILTKTSIVI